MQLHLCAALASSRSDRPGFVPDRFLEAIDEDIDLAVIELSATGRWVREDDGWRIPVHELQRVVATLHQIVAESA